MLFGWASQSGNGECLGRGRNGMCSDGRSWDSEKNARDLWEQKQKKLSPAEIRDKMKELASPCPEESEWTEWVGEGSRSILILQKRTREIKQLTPVS